jgi:hypothetical protein
MTDYSKTKIYKIESHLGDKVYVGSTAKQYLSQRFQQHKKDYNYWKTNKMKNISSYELFDEYGIDNCKIVLIEEYPCTSKDAKNAREGHFIRTLNCVNKKIEGRTRKEYYQDKKETLKELSTEFRENNKEYFKEYRENNKEQIKEQKKQIIKCDVCGRKHQHTSKARHDRSEYHIKKTEALKQSEPIII